MILRLRPRPRRLIPLSRRSLSSRSDPLRILFCGSDGFSCAALEALDAERRAGGVVESLDVVVRPGKGVGRGYKTIREGEDIPLLLLLTSQDVHPYFNDPYVLPLPTLCFSFLFSRDTKPAQRRYLITPWRPRGLLLTKGSVQLCIVWRGEGLNQRETLVLV